MGALASRGFQTSAQVQDVDSAAKFIGAGAATVGVAGTVHRNKMPGTCVYAHMYVFVVGSSIARQD